MSDQEMRNKMEFIVEQQAQFVVDVQKLSEEQAKAEARISRLEGAIVTVVNMIGELSKVQKASDEARKASDERVSAMTQKVDALTERLDAIINLIIERTMGDQNGTVKNGNN